MKKKWIALTTGLLSACFLIGMAAVPTRAAQRFSDVPENAYYAEAVNWAAANNLVNGYPDGTFGANKTISGAEIATILWRLDGSRTSSVSNAGSAFGNAWYSDSMTWAVRQSLLTQTTAPDKIMSRISALDLLWKYEGSPFPASPVADSFEDCDDILEEVTSYVSLLWANSYGVVNGVTGTVFRPHEDCTRGQFITMLYRDRMLSSRAVQTGEHLYNINATDVRKIFVRSIFMHTDEQNGVMYPRYEELPVGSIEFTTVLNAVNSFVVNRTFDRTNYTGSPRYAIEIEMSNGVKYSFGFESMNDENGPFCGIYVGRAAYFCDEDVLSPAEELIKSLE